MHRESALRECEGPERAFNEISARSVWPDFYLVGAAKCGTTSIYEHLKKHPQVYLPEMKEPNFFAAPAPPGEPAFDVPRCSNLEEYQHLYRKARGFSAIGDASNSYLWDEHAPGRIQEICPHAKIVIMLRDPVVRAHSFYLMNLRSGDDSSPTFRQALELDRERSKSSWFTSWLYVEGGMYYAQVRRYFETFGKDQVLVLFFDDLVKDPTPLFAQIAGHIGVEADPFETIEVSTALNTYRMPRLSTAYRLAGMLGLRGRLLPVSVRRWLSRNPLLFDHRKPSLDGETRRYLQQIYDPDITLLEDLLERRLPELRVSWVG
jgi:hypothetical protein